MAGCQSIWVIAEKKHIPLLKTVVGTFIEDPVLAQLPVEFKTNFKVQIPIWYASLPVRDIEKRDCYGRTILAGAEYALKIGSRLSKFATPDKFYVSFPHTVYSAWDIRKSRAKIKSKKNNFYITLDDKTIKDGICAGFTFFAEDFKRFKADFRTMDTGEWHRITKDSPKLIRHIPSERNVARFFSLDKVFRTAIIDDAVMLPLERFMDISTWDGYAAYMKKAAWFKMPKKIRYFSFNKFKELEEKLIDCGEFNDYERITKNEPTDI